MSETELGSDGVSFWSGTPERRSGFQPDSATLLDRLVEGCRRLCAHAETGRPVRLAFEPVAKDVTLPYFVVAG